MYEVTITAENFEKEVLQSELPVLVDFWAPWCGPCRALGPIIEELAEEYRGRAVVGKVNVDEEQALAMKFRVASIPTLMVFRNGKAAATTVGLQSKAALAELLEK